MGRDDSTNNKIHFITRQLRHHVSEGCLPVTLQVHRCSSKGCSKTDYTAIICAQCHLHYCLTYGGYASVRANICY